MAATAGVNVTVARGDGLAWTIKSLRLSESLACVGSLIIGWLIGDSRSGQRVSAMGSGRSSTVRSVMLRRVGGARTMKSLRLSESLARVGSLIIG